MARGTLHAVGFSGGIDSQACAKWVREQHNGEDIVLCNSDAGGNEHPLTTEFLRRYSSEVFPVTMLSPIVADLGNRGTMPGATRDRRQQFKDSDAMGFEILAFIKGRFPSRKVQFCSEHLKLIPQRRWLEEHHGDREVIRYSGVRRDESEKRKDQPEISWDDYFDCELRCPLVTWTKLQCFEYVKPEPINPLYSLGFWRVGCAPCINSGKEDILLWAQRFPEMIDKVRRWEKFVGRTFFAPCVPGMENNWIDEVVEWAGTTRGGREIGLHVLYERKACESKYGLCE